MTEADRMQKMLARAEAEVSKLKDLLQEWWRWEESLILQGHRLLSEDWNYELTDMYQELQEKRNEALKK